MELETTLLYLFFTAMLFTTINFFKKNFLCFSFQKLYPLKEWRWSKSSKTDTIAYFEVQGYFKNWWNIHASFTCLHTCSSVCTTIIEYCDSKYTNRQVNLFFIQMFKQIWCSPLIPALWRLMGGFQVQADWAT